jgi:hypothetical protein
MPENPQETLTERSVYTPIELFELCDLLIKTQIREGRINSVEELYGFRNHLEDMLHDLKARASLTSQEGAWQPIETAPKDGRVVLGWCGPQWPLLVRYRGGWGNYCNGNVESPTHWMPLPPSPTVPQAEQEITEKRADGSYVHGVFGYLADTPSPAPTEEGEKLNRILPPNWKQSLAAATERSRAIEKACDAILAHVKRQALAGPGTDREVVTRILEELVSSPSPTVPQAEQDEEGRLARVERFLMAYYTGDACTFVNPDNGELISATYEARALANACLRGPMADG